MFPAAIAVNGDRACTGAGLIFCGVFLMRGLRLPCSILLIVPGYLIYIRL